MLNFKYSDCGGRMYNEDSCAVFQKKTMLCAVLADGLGAHGGGDVASQTAVRAVKEGFQLQETYDTITNNVLTDWFYQANENILRKQSRECQMKTTMAVLCIDEEKREAQWAHLGDSRIYHFVQGKQVFCTFDHSVSRMAVLSGEISFEEIRFHADRSKLLKVVGREEPIKPEYGTCQLEEGLMHAFLICSDGFWEYVTEEDMEQALRLAETPEEWVKRMRAELEKRVDGKNDNNSAIAVFV